MKLFVEGGGDSNQLKSACREGFNKFITQAGVDKRPRIVACGSRRKAYERFCSALANGKPAMLLVDSETAVLAESQADHLPWQPWLHLQQRDGWQRPTEATEQQCHLMVECMENWLLADRVTLKQFFGHGFHEKALPATNRALESLNKYEVYRSLNHASQESNKGKYKKGEHSFKLLSLINPYLVIAASPWAARFITELKNIMQTA